MAVSTQSNKASGIPVLFALQYFTGFGKTAGRFRCGLDDCTQPHHQRSPEQKVHRKGILVKSMTWWSRLFNNLLNRAYSILTIGTIRNYTSICEIETKKHSRSSYVGMGTSEDYPISLLSKAYKSIGRSRVCGLRMQRTRSLLSSFDT